MTGDFNQDRFKNLLEKINLMKSSIERATFRLSGLQSQFNLSEKESKEILSKRDRIFKIDICPTCLQDVPETHRHNILNESENKLAKIKNILAVIKNEEVVLSIELRNYKKEMQNLDEEKTQSEILKSKLEYAVAWKQKLIKFSESKIKIEEDITLLEKHISRLRESISKYAIFEVRLRRNEIELKQATISEKNAEISLAELRKEIELLRREISLLDGDIIRKEERKRKLYSVSELIDWLSTQFLKLIEFAERNVMLKLRSEFSTLFQKWFLMLVPENSLSTQIDENFTPIIMQNESEMDYSFLSGGERTAVALAYRLALNQTINSVLSKIRTRGIIILDEPTDGFSESQIGKIRDILEELNTKQLIIVSHEQKIESFVDNILKVTKENGSSTVEIPKEEPRKDLPQSLNIQELSPKY